MRISLGTQVVHFLSYSSRRELDHVLSTSGGHHEVVDLSQGANSAFYVLKFVPQFEDLRTDTRYVGICVSQTGVEPQILLTPSAELLYLGLDSTLLILNATGILIRAVPLGDPFYSMALIDEKNRVLVAHETGVMRVTDTGDVDWQFDAPDVVSKLDFLPGKTTIGVTLLNGTHLSLDLRTGTGANDKNSGFSKANHS